MVVAPGEAAIASVRKQSTDGTTFASGMCLQRVRLAYEVGPREPDATWAWRTAQHKHPTTNPSVIPRGVPVFWIGGSSGHGHIAISAGDGACWSTDIRRSGRWDKVSISEIHSKWGMELVGWTEDINGERVYTPPPSARDLRVTARIKRLRERRVNLKARIQKLLGR